MEEGKLEFDKQYESIRGVIDLVLSISGSKAIKKDIRLEKEFERDVPLLIELDKSRITQVLINLLGNALKFTDRKGKVCVRVAYFPKGKVTERSVRTFAKPKAVRIKSKFGINRGKELTSKVESTNNLPLIPSIELEDNYDEAKNLIAEEIEEMTLTEFPSKVQDYKFFPSTFPLIPVDNIKGFQSCRLEAAATKRSYTNIRSSGPTTRQLKKVTGCVSPDVLQDNGRRDLITRDRKEGTPHTSSSSSIFLK